MRLLFYEEFYKIDFSTQKYISIITSSLYIPTKEIGAYSKLGVTIPFSPLTRPMRIGLVQKYIHLNIFF